MVLAPTQKQPLSSKELMIKESTTNLTLYKVVNIFRTDLASTPTLQSLQVETQRSKWFLPRFKV